MKPEMLLEACAVANFVQRNYEPAQRWEDPVGWAAWFISHGWLAYAINEENEIAAVAAARPVDKPGDGAVSYLFNEDGSCIFVELLIAPSRDIIREFARVLKFRFGNRLTIAFFRYPEQTFKVFDYDKWLSKWKSESMNVFIRDMERSEVK